MFHFNGNGLTFLIILEVFMAVIAFKSYFQEFRIFHVIKSKSFCGSCLETCSHRLFLFSIHAYHFPHGSLLNCQLRWRKVTADLNYRKNNWIFNLFGTESFFLIDISWGLARGWKKSSDVAASHEADLVMRGWMHTWRLPLLFKLEGLDNSSLKFL